MTSTDDVSMGEGGTPLVPLPHLADEYGVGTLLVKDESRNPTGSVHDRAAAEGVVEAVDGGAEGVTVYSPGDSAVSVAAYAGRAGLDCRAYVPTRARFDVKASVNVHGASMDVGGDDLADAREAERNGREGAFSLSPFECDATLRGLRGVGEGIEQGCDPDAVVCPTGTGELYLALDSALGDGVRLHAAQPEGCAPLVGEVGTPDTVVGELEDPDPPELGRLRDAVGRRGEAVTADDGEALDACLKAARSGVSPCPSLGVALAGLADADPDGTDTVVVPNPSSGRFFADGLRNRLVYHGE